MQIQCKRTFTGGVSELLTGTGHCTGIQGVACSTAGSRVTFPGAVSLTRATLIMTFYRKHFNVRLVWYPLSKASVKVMSSLVPFNAHSITQNNCPVEPVLNSPTKIYNENWPKKAGGLTKEG